jgi:hypothetical protein
MCQDFLWNIFYIVYGMRMRIFKKGKDDPPPIATNRIPLMEIYKVLDDEENTDYGFKVSEEVKIEDFESLLMILELIKKNLIEEFSNFIDDV